MKPFKHPSLVFIFQWRLILWSSWVTDLEFFNSFLFCNSFIKFVLQSWYLAVNFHLSFSFRQSTYKAGMTREVLTISAQIHICCGENAECISIPHLLNCISWKTVPKNKEKRSKSLDKLVCSTSLSVLWFCSWACSWPHIWCFQWEMESSNLNLFRMHTHPVYQLNSFHTSFSR